MTPKPTYEDLELKVKVLEAELSKFERKVDDTGHDIIERKRLERELSHMHDLMHYVIWQANAAIAIHDRDMKYIYVSENYLKQYKVKEKDVIGKYHYDVFPDLPQKWRDVHQRVLAGAVEGNDEDMYVRADGSVDWTRWTCRPWYESDGSIGGLIVDTEVITDRKRAEEALRKSEENYRQLFNNSPSAIYQIDFKTGRFVKANDVICEYLGCSREEITSLSPYDFMSEKSRELLSKRLIKMSLGEKVDANPEYEIADKNGKHKWIQLNSKNIYNSDGAVIGADVVAHDITERKRAEEERRSLEERLQRAEKMEALGQLAGGVAHDLNNVLGILSGYSELLLAEIPEGQRSRSHVEKILQSTEKGAAIIQDLLTLARRGVMTSDVVNLNSVVSGFLKTPVFEKMKDHHPQVTFSVECDKNLLNIKGSPIHLEKSLMNLVSNAAESIPGAGEVTIRTECRHLDKNIGGYDDVQEGDYAVLTVSDTGMGIPPEDRDKIFEPFYTKKKMGRSGTGLGLTIVWGMVKDHKGYIDLQTDVGKGTTFTLYFPVTREELIVPQLKKPIERYRGNGESVLVVDDIAEQRDIASALLTQLGYKVHVISSGEEAVDYLRGNKADILILDMIMAPGIDGLETYARVLEVNAKQKAILVSGFSETDRVREAQRLGAGAYVRKPYVMEKIGTAIRNELNR